MNAAIKIEKYDRRWPNYFGVEQQRILAKVGDRIISLEHVGSTSVPNMPAKPTIDMCLIVSSLDVVDQRMISEIRSLGYSYLQHFEKQIPDRRYFQRLNEEGEHLFHIHAVAQGSARCNDYLLFRDYLIAHPDEAKAYALLKHDLSKKFTHDREAYTSSKADFIKTVLAKAAHLLERE